MAEEIKTRDIVQHGEGPDPNVEVAQAPDKTGADQVAEQISDDVKWANAKAYNNDQRRLQEQDYALLEPFFGERFISADGLSFMIPRLPKDEVLRLNELAERYYAASPDVRREDYLFKSYMRHFVYAFRGIDNLKGKRILNLGCGSNELSPVEYDGRYTWAPRLCRYLQYLGANPVGVDLGEMKKETFERYGSIDLTVPGALDFLPDQSFDAISVQNLFDSPGMYNADINVKREILKQTRRLLKPDGKLILYDLFLHGRDVEDLRPLLKK